MYKRGERLLKTMRGSTACFTVFVVSTLFTLCPSFVFERLTLIGNWCRSASCVFRVVDLEGEMGLLHLEFEIAGASAKVFSPNKGAC